MKQGDCVLYKEARTLPGDPPSAQGKPWGLVLFPGSRAGHGWLLLGELEEGQPAQHLQLRAPPFPSACLCGGGQLPPPCTR